MKLPRVIHLENNNFQRFFYPKKIFSQKKPYICANDGGFFPRAIVCEFKTSVRHAHKLAHGKRTKNNLDYYIVKRLREEGVVSSTVYW